MNSLTNLTCDNDRAKGIISMNYTDLIFDLFIKVSSNVALQTKFLALFRNLTTFPDGRDALSQMNIIGGIARFISSGLGASNIEHLRHYLWILINMNNGSEEHKQIIIESGVIPHLISLLTLDIDIEIIHCVMIVLLQISKLNEGRQAIADINGISTIYSLISSKEALDYDILSRLLERLAMNKAIRDAIIADCMDIILTLLNYMNTSKDESIHQHIVKFFCRLIKDDETTVHIRKILRENQGISILVTSMNQCPQAKHLKTRICSILNSLFADDTNTDESVTSSEEGSEDSDKVNFDEENKLSNSKFKETQDNYDDSSSSNSFEEVEAYDRLEQFDKKDVSMEELESLNIEDEPELQPQDESDMKDELSEAVDNANNDIEDSHIRQAFSFWLKKDAELRMASKK